MGGTSSAAKPGDREGCTWVALVSERWKEAHFVQRQQREDNDQPEAGYKDDGNVGESARIYIFLDSLCSQISACLAKLSTDQDCRNYFAHTPWGGKNKPKIKTKQKSPKQTNPQQTNKQKNAHQDSEQQGCISKTLRKPLSSPTNTFCNRWD